LETGVSNFGRAKRATQALINYPGYNRNKGELDNHIIDLVADLFHLAEAKRFDPDSIYRKAWDHYEYESNIGKEAS
jgi:hypothetical protein